MTVEAGCVLAAVQGRAEAGRFFPLSLAAEGSCEIGGNLSTNAGGTAVLRYGNTRELVLGLEVVLPDGRVWNGLRGLRKDNTGYDLKHLFVGARGHARHHHRRRAEALSPAARQATAFVAIATSPAAVALLAGSAKRAASASPATSSSPRVCVDLMLQAIPRCPTRCRAIPGTCWWSSPTHPGTPLRRARGRRSAPRRERASSRDATIARAKRRRDALWQMREDITEAQKLDGPPSSTTCRCRCRASRSFVERAGAALAAAFPGVRIVAFGHVGDGNIHYNCQPAPAPDRAFFAQGADAPTASSTTWSRSGGSFSAEHGLGVMKRDEIERYKSPLELELMRASSTHSIPTVLNPGKVL